MLALDVGKPGKVAVVPLVNGLQAKEVGRNTGHSSRAFALPSERRGVVSERVDGALAAVDVVHQHVMLSNGDGDFKIRVGDGASGIFAANNIKLDLCGKERTP
jgi:hypothetical protein